MSSFPSSPKRKSSSKAVSASPKKILLGAMAAVSASPVAASPEKDYGSTAAYIMKNDDGSDAPKNAPEKPSFIQKRGMNLDSHRPMW
jgi:hypothetical protein